MNSKFLKSIVFAGVVLGAASVSHATTVSLSGSVVDLSGHPLLGVQVEITGISATSMAGGAWTIAGTVGIRKSTARIDAPTPVSGHMVLENGRLRTRFETSNVLGQAAPPRNSVLLLGSIPSARALGVAFQDTLVASWKGKRLVRLPVATADSAGIQFKIDTAWADDYDIPWNSGIAYGSLTDSRDGRVYRTVAIGSQTWMAENLSFAVDSSWWAGNPAVSGVKYGRLYQWAAAMGLDPVYDTTTWNGSHTGHQGLCPLGWHLPTDTEWIVLIGVASGGKADSAGWYVPRNLRAIRSWEISWGNETVDLYGFRSLSAGFRDINGEIVAEGYVEYTLSATEYSPVEALHVFVSTLDYGPKLFGSSVRCLRN